MAGMGPNDARHVVWAIWYVFFFFCVLLIFTNTKCYIQYFYAKKGWDGSSDENGPKQCETHCLGHQFIYLIIYCIL